MPAIDMLHHSPIPTAVADQVALLCESAISVLSKSDRTSARAFIRGALAVLGEGVRRVDESEEAGQLMDEADFEEAGRNCQGLCKKVHTALREMDKDSAVEYLKCMHRLLGTGHEGSGSLTPRPRDYSAAISRFSEEALIERLPSHQEHATRPHFHKQ